MNMIKNKINIALNIIHTTCLMNAGELGSEILCKRILF